MANYTVYLVPVTVDAADAGAAVVAVTNQIVAGTIGLDVTATDTNVAQARQFINLADVTTFGIELAP